MINKNILYETILIMNFLSTNKNCVIDELKSLLNIIPSNPPSSEEKHLYYLVQKMDEQNLIEKVLIKGIRPGGPHYKLRLSPNGISFTNSVKDLFLPNRKVPTFRIEDILGEINEITKKFIKNIFIDETSLNHKARVINLKQEIQDYFNSIENVLINKL